MQCIVETSAFDRLWMGLTPHVFGFVMCYIMWKDFGVCGFARCVLHLCLFIL